MKSSTPELLHLFFAAAVQRGPGRIAVEIPPTDERPTRQLVSYQELDEWSNALAHRLESLVTGECVVAILLPRAASIYAAQLAVLKAGAAYTCVDPGFPDARAEWILRDSGAVALLTDADGRARAARAGWTGITVVTVPEVAEASSPRSTQPPAPALLTPANLAYVTYTSGTTGQPKGVPIEHRSISNLIAADQVLFRLTPDARIGQSSSPAYDSSVEETWLAFAAGATVVVINDDTARLGPDLIGWLRRERISVLCPPPTLLRSTGCQDPAAALPDLKLLYVGGEALPRDIADRWAPGRRLVNGYGPTECSVTALRGEIEAGGAITIGVPVANLSAWVLDERLNLVRDGDRGELCLGGVGLSRGYWNRPDLTAERFVEHPDFGRLYRTGDVAYRTTDGRFYCEGRLDAQVKIRGYRIELEEVELRLEACAGVRAAACTVRSSGTHAMLCAFVVAEDPIRPPAPEQLQADLRAVLPPYMVPVRFGFVAELPTSVGGKLNRTALPDLEEDSEAPVDGDDTAHSPLEAALEAAVRQALGLHRPVSRDNDFFNDLGGDSLASAEVVTLLRANPLTSWVAVRDIYQCRTIAALAQQRPATAGQAPADGPRERPSDTAPRARPLLTTVVQAVWLFAGLVVSSTAGYVAGFDVAPWVITHWGLILFLLVAPVLAAVALLVYTPFAIVLAVMVKQVLIGQYVPCRAPVWGSFYLRHWIVLSAARIVPWTLLVGTEFHNMALRAFGARIGKRVHIHRGVDTRLGGWDLLDIGDDVTIAEDATLRLVDLDAGHLVIGPVVIGDGALIDVRAGVAAHTVIGADAHLTALSSLSPGAHIPRGERWDGVPARPAGLTAVPPTVMNGERVLSPVAHGLALIAAKSAAALLWIAPTEALTILACFFYGVDAVQEWRQIPWGAYAAISILAPALTLVLQSLAVRLLGPVREGVISRWSAAYIRVWVKTGLVDAAGLWLSGTLFWPMWLRAAGMSVGPRCEISTIINVVPELIRIGPEVFLADGIYLGGPHIHRGTVTLATTSLGARSFVGNHAVISAGQHLPADILLGVCTVATAETIRSGTSWFGHPPFELPRREVVTAERHLTHDPGWLRYANRVFWELLRLTLPVVPAVTLLAWFLVVDSASPDRWWFVVPLATLGAGAALCVITLLLKWALLVRVKPGQHALWSCWCSRWDFLYVAWGRFAQPILQALEGTLLLSWYLRAMGMSIGARVCLGRGFAHVVDPDMLVIEDDASVSAMFQAHTFEDRVLKTDRIYIRRGATVGSNAVPLYGADIGEHTCVAPHSVVMKRERLTPGLTYEGVPTREVRD